MRAIVWMAVVLIGGCVQYSDGERTGVITKFSHKGLVCKSWEGEMQLGQMGATDKWAFSVEDPKVALQVALAQAKGKMVALTYRQEWLVGPCRADTHYFVTHVELR